MSRTLHYDTPDADATHIEGTITSSTITQETPVTFKAPIIKNEDGTNNLEATIALIHAIEDQTDQDIAERPELARIPMDPPS
jgi:hypothetical protein